jgi:hypothetical protein
VKVEVEVVQGIKDLQGIKVPKVIEAKRGSEAT